MGKGTGRGASGDDFLLTGRAYTVSVRAWAFLLPTALFLLAFTYLPALRVAVEGLSALSSLLAPENLNALRVTLLYTLLTVPLSILLGLLAALALEGRGFLRQALRPWSSTRCSCPRWLSPPSSSTS